MPEENVESKVVVESFDKYRAVAAYILMLFLVVFTTIGVGLIYFPAAFITFGVLSGLVGYLLGAD